jgi:hypothetical protein
MGDPRERQHPAGRPIATAAELSTLASGKKSLPLRTESERNNKSLLRSALSTPKIRTEPLVNYAAVLKIAAA